MSQPRFFGQIRARRDIDEYTNTEHPNVQRLGNGKMSRDLKVYLISLHQGWHHPIISDRAKGDVAGGRSVGGVEIRWPKMKKPTTL